MIRKLRIKNFRSIREIEINLGQMNAFVGPNNAGKSNILKALNLILGETYPTIRSFNERDFYNYDTSEPITIEVFFNISLKSYPEVQGLRLTFDSKDCEYIAIDSEGNPIKYSSGSAIKVSTKMRDEVILLHLPLDRQAYQQLRPSQWTLYGKILRHINDSLSQENRNNFKNSIDNAYKTYIYPEIKNFEKILNLHIQQQTGLSLELKLSLLDPIELIKNLRPYFIGNTEFDAEDMGAGTQGALTIAIAQAYLKIVRQPLILAIEEPELYLHPHGCRHFYKLLKSLSEEGLQIIFTTHERAFVNIANYENINIVRNENGETKVYSGISLMSSNIDEVRLASKFNEYINEVFFAEHVILVEGFSDKIACQLALEKLGIDIDLKNISIIECESKTAIKPIAEILKHFKINTYVIIDADAKREIEELKKLLTEEFIFIQDPYLEEMLGRDKLGLKDNEKLTKEKALKNLLIYFNKVSIPSFYQKISEKIRGS